MISNERKRSNERAWYQKNKEKISAKRKAYYENNSEKVKKARAEYVSNNKEKVIACNEEYRKANPDKRRFWGMSRKARKLQATPTWASSGYMKLWYKLAKVEEERTGRRVEVDHIVPLISDVVCGLHCEDNMQLLFKEDNCSKGNRHWPEQYKH